MSVPTVTVYIEDGHAHIINKRGHGTIPAAEVAALFTRADRAPSEFARWEDGRLYHRDNLRSALTLLERADRCQFADQHTSCDELAGTHADGTPMTDLRDHPVCARHLPDDDSGALT